MINVIFRGKRRQFESLEQMLQKLGVTICNSDRGLIRNAERTGNVLFADINPFIAEMSAGEDEGVKQLVFAKDQEALSDLVGRLREEV